MITWRNTWKITAQISGSINRDIPGGIAISVEITELILEGISDILLDQKKNTVAALERISGGILREYLMESWEKNSGDRILGEIPEGSRGAISE